MHKVQFYTETSIPMDAFTVMAAHAKPSVTNPIGHFGTGLKYAVAIVLRNGGKWRMWVDGTEYEFYTSEKKFRNETLKMVRLRKRHSLAKRWSYIKLPFTLDLGKNWSMWQAYRELESNTRDENGFKMFDQDIEGNKDYTGTGTLIQIEHPEFHDIAANDSRVFMDSFIDDDTPVVYDCKEFTVYDHPSRSLYYRGVRVYDMKHPAVFTYDFKPGHVVLSEDRSASNIWSMQYDIAYAFGHGGFKRHHLFKAFNPRPEPHFEAEEITLDGGRATAEAFKQVMIEIGRRHASAAGRSVQSAYAGLTTFGGSQHTIPMTRAELQVSDWRKVIKAVREADLPILALSLEEQTGAR